MRTYASQRNNLLESGLLIYNETKQYSSYQLVVYSTFAQYCGYVSPAILIPLISETIYFCATTN